MKRRRRFAPPPLLTTAAVAVALVALALTWRRLFLGIDLSDEGFYVAVPYRMALGARPFIDEMSMLQTAEFFVYPFVKLYVWLTGGADGIVLFTRHLYLAWVDLRGAGRLPGVQDRGALGVRARGLVRVRDVRLRLDDQSELQHTGSRAACDRHGARRARRGRSRGGTGDPGVATLAPAPAAKALRGTERWLAGAGVAQALAVLAYPTLVAALPFTAVCLVLCTAGHRRRALRAWAIGAGATLAAEALLLVSFGVGNVMRCLRWQITGWGRLNGVGGLPKLRGLLSGVAHHLELYPLVVVAALAVYLAYRRWPVARLALVLAPLALLPFGEQLVSGADGFGVVYGLAAPFFYLFVPQRTTRLAAAPAGLGVPSGAGGRARQRLFERQRLAADGRRAAAGDGPERRLPGARPRAASRRRPRGSQAPCRGWRWPVWPASSRSRSSISISSCRAPCRTRR